MCFVNRGGRRSVKTYTDFCFLHFKFLCWSLVLWPSWTEHILRAKARNVQLVLSLTLFPFFIFFLYILHIVLYKTLHQYTFTVSDQDICKIIRHAMMHSGHWHWVIASLSLYQYHWLESGINTFFWLGPIKNANSLN